MKTLVLGLVLVAAACGKPQYPACDGDDDCKAKGEICVDKKCVECNSDAACVKKLGAGSVCAQNQCRIPAKPECAEDRDCGEGKKCNAAKRCVEDKLACTTDADCKDGQECFGGFCQKRRPAENVNSQCRDLNNPNKVALQSVSFDLDASDIRPDAQSTLEQNAVCLKQAPAQKVVLEGHCDARGTVEYNLTLGEQRGNAVAKVLERLGIEKKRMRVVSKGKSEPVCRDDSEDCYAKNRRVDFK